jgi:hypothetical protein
MLKHIFHHDFLGGGGHEGATSFRVSNMPREDYIKKLEKFHANLCHAIK